MKVAKVQTTRAVCRYISEILVTPCLEEYQFAHRTADQLFLNALRHRDCTLYLPATGPNVREATCASNLQLEDALSTLIQNQATFVQTETSFLGRLAEWRERTDEMRDRLVSIEVDLEQIKAILLRHDTVLTDLPEAIRQKIGFNL